MTEPAEPTGPLEILDGTGSSLLDLIDNLLNQGVVISGEVILGLAGVDLIYLRLSAVLCAADKLLPQLPPNPGAPPEGRE